MASPRISHLTVCFFLAAIMVQYVSAVPPNWASSTMLNDVEFEFNSGIATIDCVVYEYENDKFVYSYQITNTSDVKLSFFSVGIEQGPDIWGVSVDNLSGSLNEPLSWAIIGSDPQSVEALFADTIDNSEISAVLWFYSNKAPELGEATLFGRENGIPSFSDVQVLKPIPEPVSITLFASAAVICLARKRK